MKISMVTPAPPRSRKGNRVTAERWARILRSLGHRVTLEQEYSGEPCDLMVALHARRSARSMKKFRELNPDAPLIVALTGTDLYRDIRTSRLAQRSLEMASRLIVLQPLGIAELPKRSRGKARVIYQSVKSFLQVKTTTEAQRHRGSLVSKTRNNGLPRQGAHRRVGVFEVGVLGHLRSEKDPFRTARAARMLPESSKIAVLQAGAALSERMEVRARAEERSNPRYRWLGELSGAKALRLLGRLRLLVLSSKMEGGANVLSEAIALGVPVLASRISGSVGILGRDYPGYFPVGDTKALARLMERAERDTGFLRKLERCCRKLQPLFLPARERESWRRVLMELREPAKELAGKHERRPLPFGRGSVMVGRGSANRRPVKEARFTLIDRSVATGREFAREVRTDLTSEPKRLSCRFFYDQKGSELFEQICELPEYYLMRAEREILRERAREIAGLFRQPIALVELGSGSARKTRLLIREFIRRHGSLRYVPVDISRTMLEESSRALLQEFPAMDVLAIAGEYRESLRQLKSETGRAKLILWLGSNIGNLDRSEASAFLRRVRSSMGPDDRLLAGIDLRKDAKILEKAYDDSSGVTAEFNKNILARINHELGGQFDPGAFEHLAVYDDELGRVEMYLVSRRAQRVAVRGLRLEIPFAAGERVHTENSYKYSFGEIEALAKAAGFGIERQWMDRGRRFSVNVFRRAR